jgi:ribosomal protein S18 acetylase RimI-like enzyme
MRGEVEKAAANDTPRLAQTLANAFYDDPAIGWMVPNDERRRRVGPMGFTAWLEKIYLPKGSVYTDPDRKAAALWAPPGKWRMSVGVQLRLTPAMIRIVGFRRLPLIVKGLTMMDKEHPDDRPHWYLAILGTDPEYQGKGLGSGVMKPVLDRCDAEGVGAYLESSKESNIPFYRRHGFEVTRELHLPEGPPIWPMWRDPQPA